MYSVLQFMWKEENYKDSLMKMGDEVRTHKHKLKIPLEKQLFIINIKLSVTCCYFHSNNKRKRSSLCLSLVAAYPGFSSMKQLGVFLLHPGRDAYPLQGYPPALINTPGWREALWE